MDQSADYFLNELMSHMIYKRSENSQSQSWQIQIFDIEFIITEEHEKHWRILTSEKLKPVKLCHLFFNCYL